MRSSRLQQQPPLAHPAATQSAPWLVLVVGSPSPRGALPLRVPLTQFPGLCWWQVVILADPDGHEVCFVGDEAFR